jgi:hypothetical protein
MKKLFLLFALGVFCSNAYSQIKISALRAPNHIGDSVAVLAKVYSAKVFKNGMTLLNLGAPYPKQLLVLFIPPAAKEKFTYSPEDHFKGKNILVTGKLVKNIGKPEIIIYDPKQISELSKEAEENWNQFKDGQWVQTVSESTN